MAHGFHHIKIHGKGKHEALAKTLGRVTRKHTVLVKVLDDDQQVECSGTFWDGGTRSTYDYIMPDGNTQKVSGLPSSPPHFGGAPPPIVLPEPAIVETGTFCGKASIAILFVPRSNLEAYGLGDIEEGN